MSAPELIAFSQKLKSLRQEKNLELNKISDQTKININYLKDLEEGHFDFLPRLYVRSFLKIYLQQLGENWASLLNEYDAIRSAAIKPAAPQPETASPEAIASKTIRAETLPSEEKLKVRIVTEKDLKTIKKPGQWRQQLVMVIQKIKPYLRQMNIVWLAVSAVIIFLALCTWLKPKKNQPIVSVEPPVISWVEPKSALIESLVAQPAGDQAAAKPDDLKLEVKALETTWLQIIVDDSVAREFTFESGTTQRWQAKDKFKLRIGNAAGVRLVLNGRDLGKLGNSGQVIKFDLTEAGIQKSSL